MGDEIDLLAAYPRSRRDVSGRVAAKTDEDREIARRFDVDFFDGDRRHGYGGYSYHPRFWQPVVPAFVERYGLRAGMRVLDVGCAKGFLLYELARAVPGLDVWGIDISTYAIDQSMPEVRSKLTVADARDLPFEDDGFDLVISLTTLHNLPRSDCERSLSEVQRVSRGPAFVTVDAFRDDAQRRRMEDWNLTALTVLHVDGWRDLFANAGYTGDYYWFMP
ncbi:MAG: class I SAM-dependent methyltransferase [Thermoanaerobaculia bacterium]|nr:class I SAM-dependent methyltransferase [Thermoanaerobaculia bacterium]